MVARSSKSIVSAKKATGSNAADLSRVVYIAEKRRGPARKGTARHDAGQTRAAHAARLPSLRFAREGSAQTPLRAPAHAAGMSVSCIISGFSSTLPSIGSPVASFIVACLAVCATLYLPGYLFGRSLSLARCASLAAAPALSIAVLVALGAVFEAASVSCSAFVLAVALAALALAAYLLSSALRRVRAKETGQAFCRNVGHPFPDRVSHRFIWSAFALYVIVAFAICAIMFLTAIDGLDSFARKDDTTVHLSIVRSFLDTGTYSTLHSNPFLGQGSVGAYYPSAWHILTAIAASCVGNSVTIATNAVTLVFIAAVLPVGMCYLLCWALPRKRNAILAGSLFVLGFAILPWGFLTKGQLLPNLASYVLIPGAIALFIAALESNGRRLRILSATAAIWALIAVALCQPNGAFTCVIGMTSYAVIRIFRAPDDDRATFARKRVIGAVALVAVACTAWVALFYAPPLRSTVTYGTWDALLSFPEALVSGLSFMYVEQGGIQPALSIVVLFGAIAAFRDRRYLWLNVAYLVTLFIYLGNVTADGLARQMIAGFWYADYYRTAAMNALFAIPLAALGFAWLASLLTGALQRVSNGKIPASTTGVMAGGVLVVLLAAIQALPLNVDIGKRTIESGLISMRNQVVSLYSWDSVYTSEERAFVQKAQSLMDDSSFVANLPNDGTAWSYGTDGIRVMFRRTGDNGGNPFPTEWNAIVRTRLADVATDAEVQQVVRDLGIRYVILLDEKSSQNPTVDSSRYEEENWVGIESITEETPGFELLLSEGDMRLYEITAVE